MQMLVAQSTHRNRDRKKYSCKFNSHRCKSLAQNVDLMNLCMTLHSDRQFYQLQPLNLHQIYDFEDVIVLIDLRCTIKKIYRKIKMAFFSNIFIAATQHNYFIHHRFYTAIQHGACIQRDNIREWNDNSVAHLIVVLLSLEILFSQTMRIFRKEKYSTWNSIEPLQRGEGTSNR